MEVWNNIRCIRQEGDVEEWLIETGLMALIASDDYQMEMSVRFDKERKYPWHVAFEDTLRWLQDLLSITRTVNKKWLKQISDELEPLDRKGQRNARYWLAEYSLLKAMEKENIIVDDCVMPHNVTITNNRKTNQNITINHCDIAQEVSPDDCNGKQHITTNCDKLYYLKKRKWWHI